MLLVPFRINPDRFSRIDLKVRYPSDPEELITMVGSVDPANHRFFKFDFSPDHPPEWDTKFAVWKDYRKLKGIFAASLWERPKFSKFLPQVCLPLYPSDHVYHPSTQSLEFQMSEQSVHHDPRYTFTGIYNPDAIISEEDETRMWYDLYLGVPTFEVEHSSVPVAAPPDFKKIECIYAWTNKNIEDKAYTYLPGSVIGEGLNHTFKCLRTDGKDDQVVNAHITIGQLRKLLWVRKGNSSFVYEDEYCKLVAIQTFTLSDSTYDGGIWF